MATKAQQLQKLTRIRTTLMKFKISVKNVNPILENLLRRDKAPLDANVLREVESMLQVREYLKKSRLQTVEIDREINELLENLYTTFSSDTPAPPPQSYTNQLRSKAMRPEPNPKKRAAPTPSSSEPQAKKPRPASSSHTAKTPMSPSRPFRQATIQPWPLRTVGVKGSPFLTADKTCSPVMDIDQQDQSYRVYDRKHDFLNQGTAFSFKTSTDTKISFSFSRRDKQIHLRSSNSEISLEFLWVKDLDQVVSIFKRYGSNFQLEHSPNSSWPRPTPDDSEAESFSKVKKEAMHSKDSRSGRQKRSRQRRDRAYVESDSEDSSDDDYVPGRDED